MIRPSAGRDGGSYRFDLPVGMNKKISLQDKKMTRQRQSPLDQVICPSGNLGRGLVISEERNRHFVSGRTAEYAIGYALDGL
jgi:hypothetical protein